MMRIKKSVKSLLQFFKKYFSTNILFSSYIIISLLLSFTLRLLTVGISYTFKPFLYDIFIIILIGSFGYFFKPRNQFKYFFSILLFFTLLCIFNSLYYTFYKSFLSVSLIESMIMLKNVKASVVDKLKLIHFIYLIYLTIFILIHRKLSKNKYYFEVEKIEISSNMFKGTFFFGFILMILCLLFLNEADINKFSKTWNREYIMQKFGLYTYTVNDFIDSLTPKIDDTFGYDQAAYEFREFYKEESNKRTYVNEYTNIFEGKNLLVIHAESIQNFLIGLEIDGKEVTPNLNELIEKSMYFDKFYPQITTGTSSDTEFTFETGLLPSTNGITFVSYFDREYESLANILKNKGYYTFVMHANNGDYWNRNTMYKTFGYDKFYSSDSYVITEDEIIGLGLSDKEFYKQSVILLNSIKNMDKPFYGKIITLTNHSPYNEIDKYGEFDLGSMSYLDGTEMGNYLKSAHYADEALGELMYLLDNNEILDDTVIVLYGDHESRIAKSEFNNLYNYDPVTETFLSEEDENYINLENYRYELLKNTPLIIYSKDNEHVGKYSNVMGMYDLMPTLSNMFNFNYKYAVGNDIFSDNEKIVIFPNGNFLTSKVYYNSLKGDYVSISDEPIDENYIERLKKYSEKRLNISNNIIFYDLIRKEKDNLKKELKNEKE